MNFLLEGTPFSDFLLETFYLILSGILTFGIVQILASKSSQKPISVNFSTAVSVSNDVIQRILSWMRFNEITVLHGVKIRESWRAYVLKGFQNPTRGISPRRYLEATGNPATRWIYPRRYTLRMRLFLEDYSAILNVLGNHYKNIINFSLQLHESTGAHAIVCPYPQLGYVFLVGIFELRLLETHIFK